MGIRLKGGWNNPWIQGAAVFLACTLLALYFTARDLSYHHFLIDREPSLLGYLKPNLLTWYSWGILFFPLRSACRVLLRRSRRALPFIFWHALLFLAAILGHSGLTLLTAGAIHGFASASFAEHTLTFPGFVFQFMGEYDFLVYFAVVGTLNYRYYLERTTDPKIAIMQGQLADAQIQNLRNQMQPHFLFNSLNTVAAFIPGDGPKASRMLKLLSGLFRDSLRANAAPELPLADELRFVDNYLQIERLRFGERLQVVHMVEERARAALFPAMMLQTLVENAVRHGVAAKAGTGIVSITAQVRGAHLMVKVHDNGAGAARTQGGRGGGGVGIHNTCARLDMLYGRNHAFRIQSREGFGHEVEIRIPLRPAAAAVGTAP